MSLADARSRGARLNTRFGVKGIHSDSSESALVTPCARSCRAVADMRARAGGTELLVRGCRRSWRRHSQLIRGGRQEPLREMEPALDVANTLPADHIAA